MNEREKFMAFVHRVRAERGPLRFLALVKRADINDSWDVVIAAEWAAKQKRVAIEYLIRTLATIYGEAALLSISRFVVLDPDDTSVQEYSEQLRSAQAEEFQVVEFFGVPASEVVIAGPVAAAA